MYRTSIFFGIFLGFISKFRQVKISRLAGEGLEILRDEPRLAVLSLRYPVDHLRRVQAPIGIDHAQLSVQTG